MPRGYDEALYCLQRDAVHATERVPQASPTNETVYGIVAGLVKEIAKLRDEVQHLRAAQHPHGDRR